MSECLNVGEQLIDFQPINCQVNESKHFLVWGMARSSRGVLGDDVKSEKKNWLTVSKEDIY